LVQYTIVATIINHGRLVERNNFKVFSITVKMSIGTPWAILKHIVVNETHSCSKAALVC